MGDYKLTEQINALMAAMTMLLAVLCLGVCTAAPVPGSEVRSALADMIPMVQKLSDNRLKKLDLEQEIHRAHVFKQIMALDLSPEEKMENAFKIGAINASVYETFRENSGLAALEQAKAEASGEEPAAKLSKFVDPSTGGVNLDGMSDAIAAQMKDAPIPEALKEQFSAPQQFKELAPNSSQAETEVAANSIAMFTDDKGKYDKPGQIPDRFLNAFKPVKTKPFGSPTSYSPNGPQADQVNLFVDPAMGAMLGELPYAMKAAQKDGFAIKQLAAGKTGSTGNASQTDQVSLFVDPGPMFKMVNDIPAATAAAAKELPKLAMDTGSAKKNASEVMAATSIAMFTDKPGAWDVAFKKDNTKPYGSPSGNGTQADQVNLFVDPAMGAMLGELPDAMKAAQKDGFAIKQLAAGKTGSTGNASQTDQVSLFVDPGPMFKMV